MPNDNRVPMKQRPTWVGDEEVSASMSGVQYGRRFSMDIAEGVLEQVGARALEHAAEKLGELAVYQQQTQIERIVSDYITDRKWAEPIIEDAIRQAVNRCVDSMFTKQLEYADRAD